MVISITFVLYFSHIVSHKDVEKITIETPKKKKPNLQVFEVTSLDYFLLLLPHQKFPAS